MSVPETRQRRSSADWILYGILFLFFFQLLNEFVEAIYAFGLLGTSIPPEIAAVLFLFTPLLMFLFPQGISGRLMVITGELVLLCRAVEPLLDTRGRMLVAGLGTGLFLFFFPALLWTESRKEGVSKAWPLGAGLALGLSLSILLRALQSGYDLALNPRFGWVGWALALVAAFLLPGAVGLQARRRAAGRSDTPSSRHAPGDASPGNFVLLSLGLASLFVLLYFAFASPNVIARWTEASYFLVVSLLVLALALFAALMFIRPQLVAGLPRTALLLWNLLFTLALAGTILLHKTPFPAVPNAYPRFQTEPPAFAPAFLALTLALSPVLLMDFIFLTGEILTTRLSFRLLGGSFSLGSLYLLILVFAHVFTTVYDYIPVAGPLFRDRFWLVYLTPGMILSLSVLGLRRPPFRSSTRPLPAAFPTLVGLLALGAIAAPLLNSPRPVPQPEKYSLRVLTYNLQQGYSAAGQRSHTGQLDLLRQVDADLIGLQESDTNRIAGGNADLVRYLADRLNLYSYYGPKTVAGTFGITLLSRYPIENPRTFFMYSSGEQTATIAAQIQANGRAFNVFVTHLGNGGPLIQQQQFLQEVSGVPETIAMGDFNFEPSTEQYRLTTGLLADAWLIKWPSGQDDQGYSPSERIDHIFVSPGMHIVDARHILSLVSDHPAVWVEIAW